MHLLCAGSIDSSEGVIGEREVSALFVRRCTKVVAVETTAAGPEN